MAKSSQPTPLSRKAKPAARRATGSRSIEALHHFRCGACEKWWSIGDAPATRERWFCPWCGRENAVELVGGRIES